MKNERKNQKNLQKVPDPLLKNEVCSELFLHSKFLGSSKRLHSSPFSKMESSGFDDKSIYKMDILSQLDIHLTSSLSLSALLLHIFLQDEVVRVFYGED